MAESTATLPYLFTLTTKMSEISVWNKYIDRGRNTTTKVCVCVCVCVWGGGGGGAGGTYHNVLIIINYELSKSGGARAPLPPSISATNRLFLYT